MNESRRKIAYWDLATKKLNFFLINIALQKDRQLIYYRYKRLVFDKLVILWPIPPLLRARPILLAFPAYYTQNILYTLSCTHRKHPFLYFS
jgi:hypothetical protein